MNTVDKLQLTEATLRSLAKVLDASAIYIETIQSPQNLKRLSSTIKALRETGLFLEGRASTELVALRAELELLREVADSARFIAHVEADAKACVNCDPGNEGAELGHALLTLIDRARGMRSGS